MNSNNDNGNGNKAKSGSRKIAEFSISYTQYLNPQGELVGDTLPESISDHSVLIEIYKTMKRSSSA